MELAETKKERALRLKRAWKAAHPDRIKLHAERFRARHPERVSANSKRWYEANREKTYESVKAWAERNLERVAIVNRASARVHHALRTGRMIRPDACSACGKRCKPDGAHGDYSKPLEVRWLCRSCHQKWDRAEPKTLRASA
jgi:hypothetical protein